MEKENLLYLNKEKKNTLKDVSEIVPQLIYSAPAHGSTLSLGQDVLNMIDNFTYIALNRSLEMFLFLLLF